MSVYASPYGSIYGSVTKRWSKRYGSSNILPSGYMYKNTNPTLETIGTDTVLRSTYPANVHPTMQQVKGSGFAGAGSATVTGLLTTDTITASGTVPTCSVNGTLTFGTSADCWDVYVHRAGVLWAYWPGINVGQTTELDASGNGHHLTSLTTTTITERLDGSGTNYVNTNGMTVADGENDYRDSLRVSLLPSGYRIPPAQGSPNYYKSAIAYDSTKWEMAAATNLVANPGFETAGAGGADVFASWGESPDVAGDITADTDSKHGGTQSARLLSSGAAKLTRITQYITVVPGTRTKISFWTRGDGTNPGRYQITDWTNGGATLIGITSTGITGTDFQQFTIYLDIPHANPLPCVQILLYLLGPAVQFGYAYFDDVVVERADCPGLTTGGIKIFGIGDSKTIGNSDKLNGWGWLGRLPSVRGISGGYSGFVEYPIRFAKTGQTTGVCSARIDAALASAIGTPDCVCLNIGTNDISVLPAEATIKADYAHILDSVHTKWPDAVILVARPWMRTKDTQANTFAGWIDDVISTRPFVSLGPDERVYLKSTDDGVTYTADGVHPNEAGYDLTVYQWINIIDQLWSVNAATVEYPGPLRNDLIVTAGEAYPNVTVTAPLGPKFQAIPEWTNGAAVALSTFTDTAQTRVGDQMVIYETEQDAAKIVRIDKIIGNTP